jgi:hypothetical protein
MPEYLTFRSNCGRYSFTRWRPVQVVHRPLAKSSNTRKLLEFKNEFIDQKSISSRL